MRKVNERLITVDCDYLEREFAAAYLRISASECAWIENNTVYAVPRFLEAMKSAGVALEQVRYLIITHVHLDHAGGTAELLKHCPNATVLAHPRAARHLIDPARLVAGATTVYGQRRFEELYGKIAAVPAERVQLIEDETLLSLGNTRLRFLHTRGHAKHHMVVADSRLDTVFTGDAFGVSYFSLNRRGVQVIPSTSPTDFEYDEAIHAVDRIAALGTSRVHLTHFGEIRDVPTAKQQLKERLAFHESVRVALTHDAEKSLPETTKKLRAYYSSLFDDEAGVMDLDTEVNAQGLIWAATPTSGSK